MKVLLIRPQAPNKLSFTKILDNEPLELEYLHTVLANAGYDDYIFDGLIERQTVAEAMRREKPDVVAITGYITQEKLMLEFCKKAKEINPNIVTIIGGVHAQRNYEHFYSPLVDYIFRSECCNSFLDLISYVDKNSKLEVSKINGLCYPSADGAWTCNPLTPIDINSLPIPDRAFFHKYKSNYRYLELTEVATIKTSFSCPYSCNFCYCTLLAGGKYRVRDLNLVIEELKSIEVTNVQIVDDDFLVDRNRLTEFVRLVKENNIHKTYLCYARADFVAENGDLVKALAEIGFRYFLVGLEAVTDDELNGYNKQTSAEVNKKCVEVIGSTSADCIALMIAPIDATKQYFEKLYQWVKDNELKYVTVSIFTPIPGTPLYDEYADRITSTDVEDWDFLHLVLEPTYLTKREFYNQYNKLFLRLYRIARRTGTYDFMDLKFYKNMLQDYLRRKIRGN